MKSVCLLLSVEFMALAVEFLGWELNRVKGWGSWGRRHLDRLPYSHQPKNITKALLDLLWF